MSRLNLANLTTVFLDAPALAARRLSRRRLGEATLSSGRIVACDPATNPGRAPFARVVAQRGRFSVDAIVHDGVVAVAALLLRDLVAIDAARLRWEMALLPGQQVSALGPDEFFGYPVGAGLGSFMDADTAVLVDRRLDEVDNYYDDVLAAELDGRLGAEHRPRGGDAGGVVFHAGHGDGVYPSWWALDGDVPVALVTDCLTLADGDARSASQRRSDAYEASLTMADTEALLALERAIEADDADAVARQLAAGVPVNAIVPGSGDTAISSAIRLNRTAMLRLLLGTPPRCPDMPEALRLPRYFETYLEYALRLNQPRDAAMIALLREAEAGGA